MTMGQKAARSVGKSVSGLGVKKKPTLLSKWRDESKQIKQRIWNAKAADWTPKDVRNALDLFKRVRLETPGRTSAEALSKMKSLHGYLLRHPKGKEGPLPGVEIGTKVSSRAELHFLGIHRRLQSGIDWMDVKDGPDYIGIGISVVVAGEYEDDEDYGETVIYTGEGGRHPTTGVQIKDQKLEGGNLALKSSYVKQNSIRLVRRRLEAGRTVYTYDGLYKVKRWKKELGRSKFQVYKFTLVRESNQKSLPIFSVWAK